jgi:hypothetical protein
MLWPKPTMVMAMDGADALGGEFGFEPMRPGSREAGETRPSDRDKCEVRSYHGQWVEGRYMGRRSSQLTRFS